MPVMKKLKYFIMLFLAAGIVAAFGPALAGEANEVRMTVDKSVLPLDFDRPVDLDAARPEAETAETGAATEAEPAKPQVKYEPKPAAQPKAQAEPAPAAQAASPAAVGSGRPGVVKGLSLTQEAGGVRIELATDCPVDKVTYFNLFEPRRLAVDLHGQWKKPGRAVYRFKAGPIKDVRVGEHRDRLRLVLDFREPGPKAVLNPELKPGETGLEILIPAWDGQPAQ
ncbi:MAG: AMIN domain-containing protein [Desulfovibrionaceae bacterium]|nr:AMIN domain-containing protein [Desulfovibrionaceae bacterium]